MTSLAVGPMLCAALLQSPLRQAAVQPARRSAEPRMLPAREARLHKTARRAFFQGAHDEAMTCYELATLLPGMGSARSYLSKALLLSRQGRQEAARDAFAQGVMAHRKDVRCASLSPPLAPEDPSVLAPDTDSARARDDRRRSSCKPGGSSRASAAICTARECCCAGL